MNTIKINFTPFPVLITGRLRLRQLKTEDEHDVFSLRSDDRVLEFLDRPKAQTIEDARQFISNINEGIARNEWIYWAITLQETGNLIGTISLWKFSKAHSKAEIGYELLPEHQGKGLMQEALTAVINYGFDNLQLHSIEAEVAPNNLGSIKLLKRNKFTKAANSKKGNSQTEKQSNTVIYVLKNNANLDGE